MKSGMIMGLLFIFISILLAANMFDQEAKDDSIKTKADSLYNTGKVLQQSQQSEKALINLNQALPLYEQLDSKKEIGNTLNRIGMVYGQILGNWSEAKKYWQQALRIREELSDKKSIANISNNLAIVFEKQAQYTKSEEYYNIALKYREDIKDSLRICGILKNIGLLKLQQERYYDSEDFFTRSMQIAEQNSYNELIGEIEINLGLLNFSKGIYSEAHKHYNNALSIFGDDINNYNQAEILNNLGTIYSAYNDTVLARVHFKKALKLFNKIGNLDLKARILNNLGSYHFGQNANEKALKYLQASLEIKKKIENKKGIITTLINIGNLYKEINEFKKADRFYKEAKEKIDEFGFIHQKAKILCALGDLNIAEEDYASAMSTLDEGLIIAQYLENPVLLYEFYYLKGECYNLQKRYEEAERNYNKSIEKIEEIRNGIGLEEHRSSFIAYALEVYRAIINLHINKKKYELAYEFYERLKNRNLLDIMDGAFLIFDEQMTTEEIESQRNLEANLRSINKSISTFSIIDNNMRSLDSLVVHQRSIRRELDNLNTNLFLNHPDLKQKMGKGNPVDIRDAYKLINADEAVLAYMVLEKKTLCFVLRNINKRNRFTEIVELDITESELIKEINKLNSRWKPSSFTKLYNKLISPVKDKLTDVSQICIIPDKILHTLPFHALKDKKNDKYLIEEYIIYYANSLSVLRELRLIGTSGKEKIIAFGNPNFGKNGITTFRGTLASLPATEEEVKVISNIYGERSKIFTGDSASEQSFNEFSSEYGIIHLASHGLYDELNPMYSSVLLTADKNNDGFLTAREILKLELNADMVVLSACDTAAGNLSDVEGLIGLSRAFFGALVPSIVASLWPVDDYSTKLLMEEFYVQLKDGIRPAKALRDAQLSLMKDPSYSNPYFWAPFIFMGDAE